MESPKRKKWTAVEVPDDSVLKVREKRKWQIALRRYVIEKNKCYQYAPYFGLDIESFRLWLETQFPEGFNWNNFSEKWQLDHVIPVNYFDFSSDEDLRLCWHFTNIRMSPIDHEGPRPDLLSARQFFTNLFERTELPVCRAMIAKIDTIQQQQEINTERLGQFINEKRALLSAATGFSTHDFEQLNQGVHLDEVLAEKELLRNFG